MRRLFADLETPAPRRRFSDLVLVAPRRRFSDLETPATRRRFSDLEDAPRRRFGDMVLVPSPHFEPAAYYGSVYYTWAAKFFTDNLWRALPQEDVDDLLQDGYWKYTRCLELYVYGACSCHSPSHLMQIWKKTCRNMLCDRSRKKQRYPEKYYPVAVDPELHLDNSLLTIIGLDCVQAAIELQG